MASYPLNLAVDASSTHLSQALKVLRALLCLALAGCSSEVVPPMQSQATKEFVYPLAAGTTWNYRYIYSYHHIAGEWMEKRGRQVWRSTGTGTENAITILLTRIDTTRTWFARVGADTTTTIAQVDTSFSILVTEISYDIQWYQFARHSYWPEIRSLFNVRRVVKAESDTVTIQVGQWQSSFLRTISVNGVGLISWQDFNSSNYYWNEQLILESFSQ